MLENSWVLASLHFFLPEMPVWSLDKRDSDSLVIKTKHQQCFFVEIYLKDKEKGIYVSLTQKTKRKD